MTHTLKLERAKEEPYIVIESVLGYSILHFTGKIEEKQRGIYDLKALFERKCKLPEHSEKEASFPLRDEEIILRQIAPVSSYTNLYEAKRKLIALKL